MVNMTLAIPEDLRKLMRKHKEIRWTEVARQALWEKARQMELLDRLLEKSELAEKDVQEIGEQVKKGIARRHGLIE